MDEIIKKKLLGKNELLINMVIERVKRDFLDDIAITGLTGSFNNEDFHEKSDLDLIIINNTEKGWAISDCFILDDVGYDIYCTPWDSRIQEQFYRANKWINLAKQAYSDTMLGEDIGSVRHASADVLYNLVHALVSMNNTCIKRGIKRYLDEIRSLRYVPDDLESLYMSIIEARTIEDIQIASFNMLSSVKRLHNTMCDNFIVKPAPTFDNLKGTYEELWCNYRNKILNSVITNDASYVFLSIYGAQGYLDEMTLEKGTKKFDIMRYFDANNLPVIKEKFLEVMDEYLDEYEKVGREVERFTTFEQLYTYYMNH